MKKFEKTLFIYSIVAVTAILITFGIYSPSPQNLISGLLLLPLPLYFWLRLTDPQSVAVPRWSGRLLVVIVVLCALGVYGGALAKFIGNSDKSILDSTKKESQEKIDALQAEIDTLIAKRDEDKALKDELENIRDEIARLSQEGKLTLGASESGSLADLLSEYEAGPDTNPPTQSGYVSIKHSLIKELDVLAQPEFSAKRIAVLTYGNSYGYSEYKDGWYKVTVSGNTSGWVNEKDVTSASNP